MSEANHGQVASMLEGYVNQMKITPEAAGLGNTYVAQKAAMEERSPISTRKFWCTPP